MRGTFQTPFGWSPQWDKVLQRGAHFWTTFGQYLLCDKVIRQGAQFGPHLVKVHSETKSSDKGHHLFPHLAKVRCMTSSSNDQSWASFSGHIWPKSSVWYVLRQGAIYLIVPNLANTRCSICNSHQSSFILLNAYSLIITANTTYTASFPKRPDIMGAPDQVFKFDNFLDCLIRGIKADTISAIGTINPRSLCTQFLYAPQIYFNLAGNLIAFIGCWKKRYQLSSKSSWPWVVPWRPC